MIRPLSDWLVVAYDPIARRSEIIEAPDNVMESAVRTGTVRAVGPGRPLDSGGRLPMGVEVGERIAFLRWHQEHRPGKSATRVLAELSENGEDLSMIRLADILFVFTGDVRVDVP